MRKHKWKLLGALAYLSIFLLVWTQSGPSPRSNQSAADRALRENYERIQNGMTYAQVVALLGLPGDHAPEAGEILKGWQTMGDCPDYEWYTDTASVIVLFDSSYRVVDKGIGGVRRGDKPGLAQKFLKQVKAWWRRWFP